MNEELLQALWAVLERAEADIAEYDFPASDYADEEEANEARLSALRDTNTVRDWLTRLHPTPAA